MGGVFGRIIEVRTDMKRWFITGTDTGIGKTRVACDLVSQLVASGQKVAAIKPVASGCDPTPQGLRSDDALCLMSVMNVPLAYEQVNPYAFEPPIAPHIAAQAAGVAIDLAEIARLADTIAADVLVIEGVGGWCVPLGEEQMLAELVRQLRARVILVVGMRLGCINHALLTARRIQQDGCSLEGWIANCVDPDMPEYSNNLKTLENLLPVPLLGEVPWQGKLSALWLK
jgi:dethiobiotin synthetase